MSKEIINIIAEAFKAIPAGNHLVKQDSKRDKRYKKLGAFVYNNAVKRNGLRLSGNKQGVAIAYIIDPLNNKKTFKDFINDLKFVFGISGLKNGLAIAKRQKYIQEQRPKDKKYMYWEFTGVNPNHQGNDNGVFAMGQLRDQVYTEAHEKQLDIYTETSIKKNMIVYRRYGFDIYHEWKMPDGSTMWFLHYDTKSKPDFKPISPK
ncbi:hypothetical protein [Pseudofulvibacter geojedonensis]|uniref:N-acetyltransferase domain-containing protein n=1 Tax=Pseudofulvibacter geojedonensis TaxID=1123758 RepID=A0ABW3HYM9_9FLAO